MADDKNSKAVGILESKYVEQFQTFTKHGGAVPKPAFGDGTIYERAILSAAMKMTPVTQEQVDAYNKYFPQKALLDTNKDGSLSNSLGGLIGDSYKVPSSEVAAIKGGQPSEYLTAIAVARAVEQTAAKLSNGKRPTADDMKVDVEATRAQFNKDHAMGRSGVSHDYDKYGSVIDRLAHAGVVVRLSDKRVDEVLAGQAAAPSAPPAPAKPSAYEEARNNFEQTVRALAKPGQPWTAAQHDNPAVAAAREAFTKAREVAVPAETAEKRAEEVKNFENLYVKQAGGVVQGATKPAPTPTPAPAVPPAAAPASGEIIVKPGDNLGKIAGTLDAAWAQTAAAIGGKPDDLTVRLALGIALAKRNDIAKPDHITKGQVLHVPTKEEIQKTVEELKKGLLKNDNAITVDEYKTQIKNHTMAEILAPAATPAASPQSAPPSRA